MDRTLGLGLLLLLPLASCAANSSHSSTAAGWPGCDVAQGPLGGIGPQDSLVGNTYVNAPPQTPQGGTIADGAYDLVQIVRHASQPGPWNSPEKPAMRGVMRVTTVERAPDHASGTIWAAFETPPMGMCTSGRFETTQVQFKGDVMWEPLLGAMAYTTTGDTLVILNSNGSHGEAVEYILRRRP
jgi:hypothetical protein